MDFFLHLKGSSGKKVFRIEDGITSAEAFFGKTAGEQFELIRQNGSLILHNQAEGTMLNGEILPKDARKKLEINDEIFFNGNAFVLSDERERLNKISFPRFQNSFIAIPGKSSERDEKFHLEIDNNGLGVRIPLSHEKSVLGWSKNGKKITVNKDEIETGIVELEKNWSGVIAHPLNPKMVWINGQPLKSPQKLSHRDVLTFSNKKGLPAAKGVKVSFVEPPSVSFSSFGFDFDEEHDLTNSVLLRSYLKTVEKKSLLVNTSVLKSAEKQPKAAKKSLLQSTPLLKISRQRLVEKTVEEKRPIETPIVENKAVVAEIEKPKIEVNPIVEAKPVEVKPIVETKPLETKKIEIKPIEIKKVEIAPIVETKRVEVAPKVEEKIETKPIVAPIVEKKKEVAKPKAERKPLELGKKINRVKDEIVIPKLQLFSGKTKTQFAKYLASFGANLGKVWANSQGWSQTAFAKSKEIGAISFAKSKTLASSAATKLVALKEPTKVGLRKVAVASKNTATIVLSKASRVSKAVGKRGFEVTGSLLKKGAETSGKLKTRVVDVLQTNLPKLKAKGAEFSTMVINRIGAGLKSTGNSVSAGVKTLGETAQKAKDATAVKAAENFDTLKTQTSQGLSSLKESTTEKLSTLKEHTASGVSTLKTNTSSGLSTLKEQTSSGISTLKNQTATGLASVKTQSSVGLSSLKTHAATGFSTSKNLAVTSFEKSREVITKLAQNESIWKLLKNEFVQLAMATTVGAVAVFLILQLLIP